MSAATAIAAARARLGASFVLMLALLGGSTAIPSAALAQSSSSLFSATPSIGAISPGSGMRGDLFGLGGGMLAPSPQSPMVAPSSPPAPVTQMPMVPAGQVALALSARFGKDAAEIGGGLTWRVYSAKAEPGGGFKLLKEDKSAAPTLVLPAGAYIVHVGFGLATAVKPVTLNGPTVHAAVSYTHLTLPTKRIV